MKWKLGCLSDRTEAEYEATYNKMSPSRRARVDAQKQPDAKKRTLLGEMLICELLCEDNISATVCTAENGRPYIEGEKFFISISHSDAFVAAALSDRAVGIDVEMIKPISKRLLLRVLCDSEFDFVTSGAELSDTVTDKEILNRFFEVWTAKEAYFKKQGTGITNLKEVDTTTLHKKTYITDEYVITIV